jgi:hypothetical protein
MTMRRAFTLIEASIAVALGMVVAITLFAGLRVSLGCVSAADRMAVQNQLIAAAMLRLSDELDDWRSYDDPDDATAQPLRVGLDYAGRGKPFSSFREVWRNAGLQHAWSDDDHAWSAAEGRSWWRGCMGERGGSGTEWRTKPPRFGYYGISGASVRAGVTPSYIGYGTPPQPTQDSGAWLYDQQKGLYLALGFYGMADYLPNNSIFGWYEDPIEPPRKHPIPTAGGIPSYYLNNGGHGQEYNRVGAALRSPQSIYQATYNGIFAITAGNAVGASADLDTTIRFNRFAWGTWEGGSDDGIRLDMIDLFRRCEARPTMLALRPAHWPEVSARLMRTMHKAYFTNLCSVAWTDPITGASSTLRFTGFGTTLRGARRQRGLDAP